MNVVSEERLAIALKVSPPMEKPYEALDALTRECPEVFRFTLGTNAVLLACCNWAEKGGLMMMLMWGMLLVVVGVRS
jgi:hypothetical protein